MIAKALTVFKIPELRRKIFLTIALLGVYRMGFWIPLPFINQQVDARRGRVLPRMLSEVTSDRQLVEELYLKVLSRQPTRQELKVCLDYRKGITDRGEAFEDILWALLNHSEFIHRK